MNDDVALLPERLNVWVGDNGRLYCRDVDNMNEPIHGSPKVYIPQPEPVAVDVDYVANVIREIDGDNTMGAGELAEALASRNLLKGGV